MGGKTLCIDASNDVVFVMTANYPQFDSTIESAREGDGGQLLSVDIMIILR